MIGIVPLAWTIVLILKIAGLAFVTTSWWIIILWPLIPLAVILILCLLGLGVGALAYVGLSKR